MNCHECMKLTLETQTKLIGLAFADGATDEDLDDDLSNAKKKLHIHRSKQCAILKNGKLSTFI